MSNFASTLPMRNCNNFSTTSCSFLNKKNTRKKVLSGSSLISVWICWPASSSLKRCLANFDWNFLVFCQFVFWTCIFVFSFVLSLFCCKKLNQKKKQTRTHTRNQNEMQSYLMEKSMYQWIFVSHKLPRQNYLFLYFLYFLKCFTNHLLNFDFWILFESFDIRSRS